ncbi:MAG: IS110 family transposase [Pirellulales bacterium]|nr:IS110 family transposase [Pirellulales bacterium]
MTKSETRFETFVGVDLHKCTVTLAAVDAMGETLAVLKISTKSTTKIENWLRALPGQVQMAVEACPFVEWFIDRYRTSVARIEIADATKLSSLRGKRRKTDRNDAIDIAQRLARSECPLGFIADDELMQLRKLGRHWRRMSQLLARSKHSLKSMLNAANIRGPKFDGAGAHRWFLAYGHQLGTVQQQAFSDYLDIILLVERARERLRREIHAALKSERFLITVNLLTSVPGIGDIWASIIAAEIGPFDRFPNADALEFWAGMTADVKESAGRTQSGNITKAGSATLRWALCNAAVTMCRSDAAQECTRQRLIRRIGKPKANVAMGRRLLRILFAMIRDGQAYRCTQPTRHNARANAARMAKRRKEAA